MANEKGLLELLAIIEETARKYHQHFESKSTLSHQGLRDFLRELSSFLQPLDQELLRVHGTVSDSTKQRIKHWWGISWLTGDSDVHRIAALTKKLRGRVAAALLTSGESADALQNNTGNAERLHKAALDETRAVVAGLMEVAQMCHLIRGMLSTAADTKGPKVA